MEDAESGNCKKHFEGTIEEMGIESLYDEIMRFKCELKRMHL